MKQISYCIVSILIVFCFTSSSQSSNRYKETVNKVMSKFDCNEEDAKNFMGYVQGKVRRVQNNFTKIASDFTERIDKYDLIEFTIDEYFESPNSLIYTTSLNSSNVDSMSVKYYLTRLANKYWGRYDKVELYFHPNYLSLGTIHKYNRKFGNIYEFHVETIQIFKGYLGENIIYSDATIKVFGFVFSKNIKKNEWELKVRAITAKPPIELKESDWQ